MPRRNKHLPRSAALVGGYGGVVNCPSRHVPPISSPSPSSSLFGILHSLNYWSGLRSASAVGEHQHAKWNWTLSA
eukprot:450755-Pelagomonas_calceolata.AAC.7